ncbi:hypothetical protein [Priestia taiwanensis]|uniref:Uncharacterized protein n=1 Tax=Priestia taiwanensis TaxID=1347902 RepID=A0A917EMP9_9BACI|nr:hypothetical protein [Priestia taiwanensis]MBM7362414.1 hypothetical protein [Priestia taiwanensis]GGE62044.1 hypothetical protein GCM10007140_10380 [Priestia taiwanensis]
MAKRSNEEKYSLLGTIVSAIFVVISFIFGIVSIDSSLNTRKIDKNIEYLKRYEWFQEMYNDEKYRKLFFTRLKIRTYLNSSIRVRLLVKNEKARKKFLQLIELEAEKIK